MAKKPYKPYVPLKPFYVPPPPPASRGGMTMRMVMEPRFFGEQRGEQKQVMKLAPRVRTKCLSKRLRKKLFTFTGRRLKND